MAIRVAIVDDHRLVREGLTKVLASAADVEVVGTCGRGEEAVSLVAETRPDVVLLDIVLPDADGLDMIRPIRERWPDARILMLSMHTEPEYAAAAVERGGAGLVGKDASPDILLEAIRTVACGATLPVGATLTPRECEILEHVASGRSNDAIARALGICEKTVAGHCERIMRKLDVHTRAGLVAHGRRLGL
jgi:DNA-binding NarL/FixJ family response regulator